MVSSAANLFYQADLRRHSQRQNGNVESSLEWLFGPDQLVFYLESFRDSVFPPDWIPPPPRSTEEKAATRSEARNIFLDNLPEVLAKLVGQKNASIGATKLFESLQNTHVNKHLSYVFLERFVERLYGRFDIVLDHFSRICHRHPAPYAPCATLYLVPMLIGCCC